VSAKDAKIPAAPALPRAKCLTLFTSIIFSDVPAA
jgi:hypothetical protein